MKNSFIIVLLVFFSTAALAQESCSPKACGPEGTKKSEAKAITSLRSDLQAVIDKLADSDLGGTLTSREIAKGANDDESLLYIYQAAVAVHTELAMKVQSEKLLPGIKEPFAPNANKQQLVAGLKNEIKLLENQAERLD